MHRWRLAFGGIELTVETSPAHRSPTTGPTPLNPRSIMLRKNRSRPAASSRMPSSTAMASRRPSVPTPMATRTPAFSTCPPRDRLRHTPSTNTYGYSDSNGRSRHPSISLWIFLSLSLNARDGIRSPHSSRPVSSTPRVLTPAGHISISASSTLDSRLRQRSITADPNRAPFNSGTLRLNLPALAASVRPWWPARNAFRPVRPVGLVLVGREPRVALDLPADRRGVAAEHQADPADAGAVADLDLDDLAFLFRQVRIYFSHRCNIPSDWFSGQSPI